MKTKFSVSKYFLILIFITSAIFLNSCADDSNPAAPAAVTPNVDNLLKLGSEYAIGGRANVTLYADDTLHEGYNNIYVVLYDSLTGALMTDAHVEFDIVNHGHSVPVENPADENAVGGIFKGAFILNDIQSGDNPLHFHYHVMVHNHAAPGEPEGEAAFGDFRVIANPDGFKSIIMPDSTALYLSFISPENPVTGLNDFEFLINKNEPELFPPDGSYTVIVTPELLSSGHTTTNNVNPVGASDGHYKGKINLDQSGAWRIKLRVSKNETFYDTYFDVSY